MPVFMAERGDCYLRCFHTPERGNSELPEAQRCGSLLLPPTILSVSFELASLTGKGKESGQYL